MSSSRRPSHLRVVRPALAALALTGCGHPASVEECEIIVERIARLELEKREPNNPGRVQEEIEATKEELRNSTMKNCVGKRITNAAMTCVKQAKTSQEIVEDCFD